MLALWVGGREASEGVRRKVVVIVMVRRCENLAHHCGILENKQKRP